MDSLGLRGRGMASKARGKARGNFSWGACPGCLKQSKMFGLRIVTLVVDVFHGRMCMKLHVNQIYLLYTEVFNSL